MNRAHILHSARRNRMTPLLSGNTLSTSFATRIPTKKSGLSQSTLSIRSMTDSERRQRSASARSSTLLRRPSMRLRLRQAKISPDEAIGRHLFHLPFLVPTRYIRGLRDICPPAEERSSLFLRPPQSNRQDRNPTRSSPTIIPKQNTSMTDPSDSPRCLTSARRT